MKILKKVTKDDLKEFIYNIDIKDENIYKEANNPYMLGIFQLTAGTAKTMVEKIKPSNFDELNACNAFARPGTMDFVEQYIKNRTNKKSPYPKIVADILQETNSIILYQEQVMSVFNIIGGFTMEETNYIRGLMKKLSKLEKNKEDLEAWDKVIEKFQQGALTKNISAKDAKMIAEDLLKMSSYNFNKSHSTAYTYIAVITLYLSYYFRKYFYSSVLHYEVERDKYLLERLQDVKRQGFKILPPDINKSSRFIAPVKDSKNELIFGLEDIKYVGENPVSIIIKNRPYTSFIDFYIKTQGNRITSKTIKALIGIGAFDSLHENRKKLMLKADKFFELKKSIKVEEKLRFLWNNIEKQIDVLTELEVTQDDLREYEKEYLGFNFFITPFSTEFLEKIYILKKKGLVELNFEDVRESSAKVPVIVNAIKVFNDKNGNEMAFIEIEDSVGEKIKIPIFASYWKYVKDYFVAGKVHLINLYKKIDENNEESIMFGKKGFPKAAEIERFVKRLDNL